MITVAGVHCVAGYSGDGLDATLNYPTSINAVDSGEIFFMQWTTNYQIW